MTISEVFKSILKYLTEKTRRWIQFKLFSNHLRTFSDQEQKAIFKCKEIATSCQRGSPDGLCLPLYSEVVPFLNIMLYIRNKVFVAEKHPQNFGEKK